MKLYYIGTLLRKSVGLTEVEVVNYFDIKERKTYQIRNRDDLGKVSRHFEFSDIESFSIPSEGKIVIVTGNYK